MGKTTARSLLHAHDRRLGLMQRSASQVTIAPQAAVYSTYCEIMRLGSHSVLADWQQELSLNFLGHLIRGFWEPDCPSDAFATAASPSWVTGRAVAGRGIAPIPGVAVAGGGTGKGTGIADRKLDA
jgi:hypothetical protein